MANYWAQKGKQITIFTLDHGTTSPFYELSPSVETIPLKIAGISANPIQGVISNLKRVRVLRQAIRQSRPQVTISFMARVNMLTLLAIRGLSIPVIISERNDPSQLKIGRFGSCLRRLIYPQADCIVMQAQSALSSFPLALRQRARVIPNPVSLPSMVKEKEIVSDTKVIMAMGSLTHQKGFDLLLNAFARLAPDHSGWALHIWGNGPLLPQLTKQRDELDLEDQVHFCGQTKHPFDKMRQADMFVLSSSRYEGFPNVLCEAMACGLPVISFDCPSGPSDIIRNGFDGILIPSGDVEALSVAMQQLMNDVGKRKALSFHAPEVLERFSVDRVMKMWEDLIDE